MPLDEWIIGLDAEPFGNRRMNHLGARRTALEEMSPDRHRKFVKRQVGVIQELSAHFRSRVFHSS